MIKLHGTRVNGYIELKMCFFAVQTYTLFAVCNLHVVRVSAFLHSDVAEIRILFAMQVNLRSWTWNKFGLRGDKMLTNMTD